MAIARRLHANRHEPARPGPTAEPADAWGIVDSWLDAPVTWIPQPTNGHRRVLGRLVRELDLHANLIPDAVLATLCIEHGLAVVSADSDFARFIDVSWINPLS